MILGMTSYSPPDLTYLLEQAISELAEDVGEGLFERACAYMVHFDDEEVRFIAATALAEAAVNKARAATRVIERESLHPAATRVGRSITKPAQNQEKRKEARERYRQERQAGLMKILKETVDTYADALRIEWTKELLNAPISSRDGQSRTTWGEATLPQHEERYEMFSAQAIGNAEGAARHRKAIDLLRETSAENLYEATGQLKPVKSLQELVEAGG